MLWSYAHPLSNISWLSEAQLDSEYSEPWEGGQSSTIHTGIKWLGLIVPATVVGVVLLTVFALVIYFKCTQHSAAPTGQSDAEAQAAQPEIQVDDTLCMEENALYDYKAIFRVGDPTDEFDMRNGFVDFQILGLENDPLTCSVRFKCCLLGDDCEMHFLISRITMMPPISGLMVSHSDPFGDILLYDYMLVDMNAHKVLDARQFNKYITNRNTVMVGQATAFMPQEKSPIELPEGGMGVQAQSSFWLACDLPQVQMTAICAFLVLLLSLLIMLFEHFTWFFEHRQDDGSLWHSLLETACITPAAATSIAVIYLFKLKNYTSTKPGKRDGTKAEDGGKFCSFEDCLVMLLFLGSTICALFVIYLSLDMSLMKALFWFSTVACSSSFVLGFLVLAGTYFDFKSRPSEEGRIHNPKSAISLRRIYQSRNQGVKTTFPTPLSVSKGMKKPLLSSAVGPKMVNPKTVSKFKVIESQRKSLRVPAIIVDIPINTVTDSIALKAGKQTTSTSLSK